jgi:hypothetical protein
MGKLLNKKNTKMKTVTFKSVAEMNAWTKTIPAKSLSLIKINPSPDLKTMTVSYC